VEWPTLLRIQQQTAFNVLFTQDLDIVNPAHYWSQLCNRDVVAAGDISGYYFDIARHDATWLQHVKELNACLAFFGGAPYSLKKDT
jgi:hypothetical protein